MLVYLHYNWITDLQDNIKSAFLISRLGGKNFTTEGKKQLQQAAEERISYPDFVALNLDFILF